MRASEPTKHIDGTTLPGDTTIVTCIGCGSASGIRDNTAARWAAAHGSIDGKTFTASTASNTSDTSIGDGKGASIAAAARIVEVKAMTMDAAELKADKGAIGWWRWTIEKIAATAEARMAAMEAVMEETEAYESGGSGSYGRGTSSGSLE